MIFLGKVVFISGGPSSVCKAQAKALVSMGADAAIVGRKEHHVNQAAEEVQKARNDSKVIACPDTDIRDLKSLELSVKKVLKVLKRIDFVIAGSVGNYLGDFNSISSSAFEVIWNIDYIGSLNTVLACWEQLSKNQGCIVFDSPTLHNFDLAFSIKAEDARVETERISKIISSSLDLRNIKYNFILSGNCVAQADNRYSATLDIASCPGFRKFNLNSIEDATIYLFSLSREYLNGSTVIVSKDLETSSGDEECNQFPVLIIDNNGILSHARDVTQTIEYSYFKSKI